MKFLQKGLSLAIFFFALSLSARSEILHTTYATWYGQGFFGHMLAAGKPYARNAMFVAHRTYPFGTTLRITNLRNHRSVIVTVEDRGPYADPKRDFDLSYAAAQQLDMISAGVIPVSYSKITPSLKGASR